MPIIKPSLTSRFHSLLTPRPPRLCLLLLQCPQSFQPVGLPTITTIGLRRLPFQLRRNSGSVSRDWKGSSPDNHVIPRAERNDSTDPESEAASKGLKNRKNEFGIADSDLPQGVTERQGTKFSKKAKQEYPKAPEPLIGVNDERGRKGD